MERSQIYISAFPALKLPFFRELFFLVALFSTRVEWRIESLKICAIKVENKSWHSISIGVQLLGVKCTL